MTRVRNSDTTASRSGRSSLSNPGSLTYRLAHAIAGHSQDFSEVEPTEIRAMTTEHAVSALLAFRHRAGGVTGLDEDFAEQLRLREKALGLEDADQRRQTKALLDLLADAGLDVLLLKGLPVGMLFYPESHLRQRVDLDVYFPRSQEPGLREVLTKAGYALDWHDRNPVTSHQFTATAPPPTMRPVVFDMHRCISNRAVFSQLMPFELLWKHRQPIPDLHPGAYAPATHHLLLHACIHRLAHGRGRDHERLIWLYDLHLLLRALTPAATARFVKESLAMKVGTVCAEALKESRDVLGSPVSDELLEELSRKRDREPSAKLLHAGRLPWLWSDFKGQARAMDKVNFIKETVLNQVRGAKSN